MRISLGERGDANIYLVFINGMGVANIIHLSTISTENKETNHFFIYVDMVIDKMIIDKYIKREINDDLINEITIYLKENLFNKFSNVFYTIYKIIDKKTFKL